MKESPIHKEKKKSKGESAGSMSNPLGMGQGYVFTTNNKGTFNPGLGSLKIPQNKLMVRHFSI